MNLRYLFHLRYLFLAVAIAFTFLTTSADAAEIGCDSAYKGNPVPFAGERWPSGSLPTAGKCAGAFLIGPIAKGDYEKVRAFYANNHPFLDRFTITSPGRRRSGSDKHWRPVSQIPDRGAGANG